MKKFLCKIFIFMVLLISFNVMLLNFLPVNPDNYLLAYDRKIDLLKKESASPRLILVGGSALSFGIDSKMIEDSLHINVINYGLHGGIGLKYMIDDIYSYIKNNDILIIAPEYALFFGSSPYGSKTLSQLIYLNIHGNSKLLNLKQKLVVLEGIPSIIKLKLNYTIHLLRKNTSKKEVYALSSFNQYGDVYIHWDLPSEKYAHRQKNREIFNHKFGRYFVEKVKYLEKRCKVLIIPPVITETGFNAEKENIDEVNSFLLNSSLPFLVPPETHMVPDDYGFDGDMHVNRKGVDFYSNCIIKELNDFLLREVL